MDIVSEVAKTIARETGASKVSKKHKSAAIEAIIVIGDALRDAADEGEEGIETLAVAGFLVETALAQMGAGRPDKATRQFMDEINAMTGSGGEIYGHRD